MDVVIFLLVVFGAGVFVGKMHTYWHIAKILREVAEASGIDIEKELKKRSGEEVTTEKVVYKLEVETHGDVLYLFDKETDQFICQGSSVQELAELAKQYKNVLYAAVKYNDKVFAFKDGKSIEVIA